MKQVDYLSFLLKKSDTVKPIYYEFKCLLKINGKNLSVETDSTYAYTDLNKNIIRPIDVFK